MEVATKYGPATHKQFEQWRNALDQWQSDPGACDGFAFGEIVARKPQP